MQRYPFPSLEEEKEGHHFCHQAEKEQTWLYMLKIQDEDQLLNWRKDKMWPRHLILSGRRKKC